MSTDKRTNEDEAERARQLPSGFTRALRPGSRLERIRASHTYGFVLLLVFISFAFTALTPAESWSLAIFVLIEATILSIALWTSGLAFGRMAIPMIAVIGLAAALGQASSGSSTTRGTVTAVEVTFLLCSCAVIALGVWDQREVNRQSVQGALSIYVTIGMLFTIICSAMADLGSGPFFAQGTDGDPAKRLYFSFVTLATLGYGDYTAANDLGRMLAVIEALMGQLYLVTVIAFLVANLGHRRGEPR
jgi:Ion channel